MLPDCGLTEKEQNELLDAFARFPEIEEVILYGSRAKGTYRKGSDIDLAIKGAQITESIRLELYDFLENETFLPYFFDVTHYEQLQNPDLKAHIDRAGKKF